MKKGGILFKEYGIHFTSILDWPLFCFKGYIDDFFSPFFTGLLLAYLHRKSQCLQLLEHVGVRIQVELWWTQNGSIQDSRWKLEDASKLVGIFGNDEICSQRCKFFSFWKTLLYSYIVIISVYKVPLVVWRLFTPPRTPSISRLKSQILKPTFLT